MSQIPLFYHYCHHNSTDCSVAFPCPQQTAGNFGPLVTVCSAELELAFLIFVACELLMGKEIAGNVTAATILHAVAN